MNDIDKIVDLKKEYKELESKQQEIEEEIDTIMNSCNHDIYVCFNKGRLNGGFLFTKYLCLNCGRYIGGPALFLKDENLKSINIDTCMELFDGLSDYETLKVVSEYYKVVKENNPDLQIDELLDIINGNMCGEIEEVKKRVLV